MDNDKARLVLKEFVKYDEDYSEKAIKRIKKAMIIAADVYYNSSSNPIVTDKVFDKVTKKYEKVTGEKFYGAKPDVNSGKKLVDTEHRFPELVGTLDKINTIEEFKDWIYKKIKDLNIRFIDQIPMIASLKEDGNSVVGVFDKDGNTIQWLTRGKEGVGLDLTSLFKTVKIPVEKIRALECIGEFGIKFEAVMTDDNLIKYSEDSEKTYANSRAAVAGILSAKDGKKWIKYVQLVPIRIQTSNDDKQMSRNKEIEIISLLCKLNNKFLKLESWSFFVSMFKNKLVNPIDNESIVDYMDKLYTRESENRNKLGKRPIDGIVIEFADYKHRNKLGRVDDRNKFDVALKFPYQVTSSSVVDIEFSVGRTGRITPVVIFKPLKFNGNVCDHVSIANYKRFKELDLCKGTKVVIEYRNDVLCYLNREDNNNNGKKPIPFITKCPVCGSDIELSNSGVFAYCSNRNCPGRNVGKITNWIEKLGLKGINEKTIETLVSNGLVKNIDDLYRLKVKDILELDGFKLTSSKKIVEIINSRLDISDWELLGSLNIEGIGRGTSKTICRKMDFDKILDESVNNPDKLTKSMMKIKDIGESTVYNLINGVKENIHLITRLMKVIKIKKSMKNDNGEELNIVFSGFRDKTLERMIEDAGYNYKSSISTKTNILVVRDINQVTSKTEKAKEIGIKIMAIKDFAEKYLN